MKALLDTNIVIHRENTKPTNSGIGLLFYWLDKLHYEKYIHPLTVCELRKLHNANMQSLYDAKLAAYSELKTTSIQDDVFKKSLPEIKTSNDEIDNQLLCEVYTHHVDLLITEDKQLRQKARRLKIQNNVLSINEFITNATEEYPELINYKMLAVKKEYFGNIDVSDSFFETFRIAYKGFDNWFAKKSEEESYICRTDKNEILGFLYLKTEYEDENYTDITPVFTSKKRLKIGTFKVETSGFRLGERFIKIIFDNAVERKVDEIYVTLFEDRPELKALEDLLTVWGFERFGEKSTNEKKEAVFVKQLGIYNNTLSVKENFPNVLLNKQKFIVPILAKYHTTLLPDSKLNTENEIDFLGKEPHKYALQKVYISWAPERNVNPGDILVFYRMGEENSNKKYTSVLTTIGIVDRIEFGFKTKEEFLATCQNRSVFSKNDLELFWINHRYNLMVLKFIFVKSLIKRPTLEYLWNNNIVKAPNGPRPFLRIDEKQFNDILVQSKTTLHFIKE